MSKFSTAYAQVSRQFTHDEMADWWNELDLGKPAIAATMVRWKTHSTTKNKNFEPAIITLAASLHHVRKVILKNINKDLR